MRTITEINAPRLAMGLQQILLDMRKEKGAENAKYPIREFERIIMESKHVSEKEAARVTESVINTGIIR